MPPPDLFAYLDYRSFLEDWLAWKTSGQPDYSAGVFAKQARLSRATLPNVLGRRRHPNAETLVGFVRAMRLGPEEAEFLALLVDLERATSIEEEARVLRRIFDHPRYRPGQVIDAEFLQVSRSWCGIAIIEFSKLPGFQPDATWIAERLRPEVPLAEVERALQALQEAGLIGSAAAARLHTPPEVKGVHARLVHLSALDAAKAALSSVPRQERVFNLATLSVPQEIVPEVLAEVEAMIGRLSDLADRHAAGATTLVQVNVQAWQVTGEGGGAGVG